MGEAGTPMQSWLEMWNEWEIQTVVVASFSLQVILFFFAGIRRCSISFVVKALLWLVYLLADLVATYALGHISSSLSKKSSGQHQLVAFWAPFLVLHLGGQDTITAYALEDNELWLRHLLNMFVQVSGTGYVLYKYINAGEATFVQAAMLVLAAGVLKYGERIWALKLASKGGSRYKRRRRSKTFRQWINGIRFRFLTEKPSVTTLTKKPIDTATRAVSVMRKVITKIRVVQMMANPHPWVIEIGQIENERNRITKNKQFASYAFLVMTAHVLRRVLVKPLIIDRNEASIILDNTLLLDQRYIRQEDQSEDAKKRHMGEIYKKIEVQLSLMYDMLYTKAEVIHTRYGHCLRAISLVSCFAALVVFTKSKRDVYSTPDIVITFALLAGACALEMASAFKAIGSTWTCAILRRRGWKWLANAILFTRYHLLLVEDGRWSDSVGQFNFTSFCVHSNKMDLKGRIAKWIGAKESWDKARCTKHAKLSAAVKEFVWGLLIGNKSDMVLIEDVATRSGYWARKFKGFEHSTQLDWSMGFEFQKSVLIWHIATDIFLNDPYVKSELVDEDMAQEVNTLSDYMLYLLVEHPNILPTKPAARSLFDETYYKYSQVSKGDTDVADPHKIILKYEEADHPTAIKNMYGNFTHPTWDEYPGQAVLASAGALAQTLLKMDLVLTHKMGIIATVWNEMLCYTATNATGDFHARRLSNGGEFLTHILLLTQYSAAMPKIVKRWEATDVEASAAGDTELDVESSCTDEITEIH